MLEYMYIYIKEKIKPLVEPMNNQLKDLNILKQDDKISNKDNNEKKT